MERGELKIKAAPNGMEDMEGEELKNRSLTNLSVDVGQRLYQRSKTVDAAYAARLRQRTRQPT